MLREAIKRTEGCEEANRTMAMRRRKKRKEKGQDGAGEREKGRC